MTIDKGTADGLRPDMAVIAPAGVVGRDHHAERPGGQGSAADRPERRGRRHGGAVAGPGGGGGHRAAISAMNYVSGAADVKVGDTVVTSGIDGIYPKGFVIGQIESISGAAGDFSAIVVRPAVEFSSLEAVLVVVTPRRLRRNADGLARMRVRHASEGRRGPDRGRAGARAADDPGAFPRGRDGGARSGAGGRRVRGADERAGRPECWPAAWPG